MGICRSYHSRRAEHTTRLPTWCCLSDLDLVVELQLVADPAADAQLAFGGFSRSTMPSFENRRFGSW
jgi:hypothetical protein